MEKQIGEMKKGCLVISLDFEMMWGNLEHWSVEEYGRTNVQNVRTVVNRLIDIFDKYQVHATFATVGMLMLHDKQELEKFNIIPPGYKNTKLSPFEKSFISNIYDESLYFASDVVSKLKEAPNIEIGTHTFSHYYCWEEGQTLEQFDNDIENAIKVADINGIKIHSIVFPRNNVSESYLKVCTKYGISSYRGNPAKLYDNKKGFAGVIQRILRLLDLYLNLGNKTSYVPQRKSAEMINIPASRFVRPYSKKLSWLDGLRFRRIRKEMIKAAKQNEVYHLWWHPHNFGADIDKNFLFLQRILDCFLYCKEKYGMQSFTMKELSEQL